MITGVTNLMVGINEVQRAYVATTIVWGTTPPSPSYETQYFTTRSLVDNNTIRFTKSSAITSSDATSISYSTDNGITWNTRNIDSTNQIVSVTLDSGETAIWRGIADRWSNGSKQANFDSTGNYEVEGNIMSLLYGDNFVNQTTLTSADTFFRLFYNSTQLLNAENLCLPATTLTEGCYIKMFQYCTSLTTAPELPATTLAYHCYDNMFYYCTSLTTAPELPATTLAEGCYQEMFYKCRALTTAPALPATTLAEDCYSNMFYECTRLTTAPELPATTLAYRCYGGMFNGCTSLNYIKCLATNISAPGCTSLWVSGVASSGTFVKDSTMSGWSTGISAIPSGWTVQSV